MPSPTPPSCSGRRTAAEISLRGRLPADGEREAGEVWDQNVYGLTAEQIAGGTVVDLGANVGAFTLLACELGSAHVLAVEAEMENAARLERVVKGLPVDVAHVAVGIGPGIVGVYGTGAEAWTAELVPGHVMVEPRLGIDDLWLRLPVGEVALCKLDVEGAEYDAIEGASTVALQRCRRLVMEFHGPGLLGDRARGDEVERFGRMVAKLADTHHVRVSGRPTVGGMLYCDRL